MTDFLAGATTVASLGVSLFFLRYWRDSRDRLFAWFSAAFLLFAVNRVVLTSMSPDADGVLAVYVVRLVGFLMIIGAIVDKNRR